MKERTRRKGFSRLLYLIGGIVLVLVLRKGIEVFTHWPIYPTKMKACKTETALIEKIRDLDLALYYPEQVSDDWLEVSYRVVLDGRNIRSKVCGYDVVGNMEKNGSIYKVEVRGERNDIFKPISGPRKQSYRNVEYYISDKYEFREGRLDYGEYRYYVYVRCADVEQKDVTLEMKQCAETIMMEIMEIIIDGVLQGDV